jgi:hypothetical protein
MALPSGTYAPRDPAAAVLYQVVRDHYRTFRAEASQFREGEGLPRFVDDEFDAFLRCGWRAGGRRRIRPGRLRSRAATSPGDGSSSRPRPSVAPARVNWHTLFARSGAAGGSSC